MARVLIIDDEDAYREYLARKLEREGHEVDVAASAESALALCAEFSPELVVVDFMLRGNDSGVELYKRIRDLHPASRAILITGFPSEDVQREASQARMSAVFHKPFSLHEFSDCVEKLFPR